MVIAYSEQKAKKSGSRSIESAPPATTTSARPDWISFMPAPTTSAPLAHAPYTELARRARDRVWIAATTSRTPASVGSTRSGLGSWRSPWVATSATSIRSCSASSPALASASASAAAPKRTASEVSASPGPSQPGTGAA